jgi:hypothetical protein
MVVLYIFLGWVAAAFLLALGSHLYGEWQERRNREYRKSLSQAYLSCPFCGFDGFHAYGPQDCPYCKQRLCVTVFYVRCPHCNNKDIGYGPCQCSRCGAFLWVGTGAWAQDLPMRSLYVMPCA